MTGHDPYRAKSARSVPPAAPDPTGIDDPDFGSEPFAVPDNAHDVVAWIRDADGDERVARAEAAWSVELGRDSIRKTVADAVSSSLDDPVTV